MSQRVLVRPQDRRQSYVPKLMAAPAFAQLQIQPAPVAAPRVQTSELRMRFPRWLRAVERIHCAGFNATVVITDFLAVLAAGSLNRVDARLTFEVAFGVVFAFLVSRVYTPRGNLETQGVLWYLSRVISPLAVVGLFVAAHSVSAGTGLKFGATIFGFLVGLRAATWMTLFFARRHGWAMRRALVVGSGPTARAVVSKLTAYPDAGLLPVGILSPDGRREGGEGIGTGALPADLPTILRHGRIEHVVLVPEGNDDVGVASCLDLCDGLEVDFSMLPPLAELYIHPGRVAQVGGLPLITLGRVARSRQSLPGKRTFDLAVSSVLLLLVAPLMVATAVAVWLDDRGPILYRQRRVGQGGRPLWVLKFRSMVVGADSKAHELAELNVTDGLLFKVRDDPRVTRVGRVIRRLSIDELPQLFNVVRGDMSLVGPRPLAVDPDDFGVLDGKRHSVPPGMTGYWQIVGGNGLTYNEMVKLDLAYIQNWSLWLDLRLLARTIPALVHRRGPS